MRYRGFVHAPTQRTGIIEGDPGPQAMLYCRWDDTGLDGLVSVTDIKFIEDTHRHITDGVRVCHCGPSTIEGIVMHRGIEDLN